MVYFDWYLGVDGSAVGFRQFWNQKFSQVEKAVTLKKQPSNLVNKKEFLTLQSQTDTQIRGLMGCVHSFHLIPS